MRGIVLRHYGFYTDYAYYFVPPPLYIPISRTPFKDGIPQGPPLRPTLRDYNDVYYRGFYLSVPDSYHYEEWKREFDQYVSHGNLPALEIMSLPLDHFGSFGSNVGGLNTPSLEIADNDYALGRLVQAVSISPYWKDTAIFVVEDDAQDGPDHVDAHRSPAFVISAYTKRNAVIHTCLAHDRGSAGAEPSGDERCEFGSDVGRVYNQAGLYPVYRSIAGKLVSSTCASGSHSGM
jgi:hypothetical protein